MEPVSGKASSALSDVKDELSAAETLPPILMPPVPLPTRLNHALKLWSFKALVHNGLTIQRLLQPPNPSTLPTQLKTYPCRPTLSHRIFVPRSHGPLSSQTPLLPLYIDFHGGGFAVCDPQTDDLFCSSLANTHNMLVVSVAYRKAPLYPFPIPVEDAIAVTAAILDDPDLPTDKAKVAAGGFSAGANLALAMAQDPSLRHRIKGLVAFYPPLDFTQPVAEKLLTRPTPPDGHPDPLEHNSAYFNWGYVPAKQDRRDSRLSPVFARKEDLPSHVFLIGAEYDMLCREARVLAESLAGVEEGYSGDSDGSAWAKGGVRWELARGYDHAFTHLPLRGDAEVGRRRYNRGLYERVVKWLREEAFD